MSFFGRVGTKSWRCEGKGKGGENVHLLTHAPQGAWVKKLLKIPNILQGTENKIGTKK